MPKTKYLVTRTIRISKGTSKVTSYYVLTPEQYERRQDRIMGIWSKIWVDQIMKRWDDEQMKRPDEAVSLSEVLKLWPESSSEEAEVLKTTNSYHHLRSLRVKHKVLKRNVLLNAGSKYK